MDQTKATQLSAALRSGDYPQALGDLLRRKQGYSVLGVLCDLYFLDVGGAWYREGGSHFFEAGGEICDQVPPTIVRAWAGINSSTGRFTGGSLYADHLDGRSFADIATTIDNRWAEI